MVLPSNKQRVAAPPGRSLLKKKPAQQLQQARLPFGAAEPQHHAAAASSSSAPLRQASIFDCRGVVQYSSSSESAQSAAVPTTLYLGQDDVLLLKSNLEAATDREAILSVLRRLSAMPCTRQLLKSTRIGVAVGHLRQGEKIPVGRTP